MQSSIVIEDGLGSEILTQMNNAFETLASEFTGSSEPEATYVSMIWIDTSGTNPVKKQRNADNTDWITLGTFVNGIFQNADRASITTTQISLSTTWTGSEAPYEQEISISGMTANDVPTIALVPSGSYSEQQEELKQYGKIYRAVTDSGKITFYAKEATTVALTLQMQLIK